jgi:hypothetical protein
MDAIFAGLIADGGEWPERVDSAHWIGRAATVSHWIKTHLQYVGIVAVNRSIDGAYL